MPFNTECGSDKNFLDASICGSGLSKVRTALAVP
jgi:hypothetical protein